MSTQQDDPTGGKGKQEKNPDPVQTDGEPEGDSTQPPLPGKQPGHWSYHPFTSPKGTQRQTAMRLPPNRTQLSDFFFPLLEMGHAEGG